MRPAAPLLLCGGFALASLAPAAGAASVCVEVQGATPLSCLNDEMADMAADAARERDGLPAIDGASAPGSPTEAGLFNQTATRIRMGTAFGVSVYPQRPPRYFTSPLPVRPSSP